MQNKEVDYNKILKERDNGISELLKMPGEKILPKDITDSIIDSVTELDYRTLTKEQSRVLTVVVKEVLKRVREINKDVELALVYDLNGYKNQYGEWLFQETGKTDTDYIYLGNNTDIYHILSERNSERIVIISHNHPNNRVISLLDIRTLIESDNTRMVVAVTNAGKISYIVKEKFDIKKYNELMKDIMMKMRDMQIEDINKINDMSLIMLLERCSECGLFFYKEV